MQTVLQAAGQAMSAMQLGAGEDKGKGKFSEKGKGKPEEVGKGNIEIKPIAFDLVPRPADEALLSHVQRFSFDAQSTALGLALDALVKDGDGRAVD